MHSVLDLIKEYYRSVIEISILWAGLYTLIRAFRHSRAANIFLGLVVFLLGLTFVTELLHLQVVEWILTRVAALLAVGLLVIFQPELRSAFARIGSVSFLGLNKTEEEQFITELVTTVESLSRSRHGALIALEKSMGLNDYATTGVPMESRFTQSLMETIFHPKTTLHDGGVIISQRRILAASCLFPVSQRELADRSIGLRHRAGLGLVEECDALVIIVSEETGKISIALNGQLERGMNMSEFRTRLTDLTGTTINAST